MIKTSTGMAQYIKRGTFVYPILDDLDSVMTLRDFEAASRRGKEFHHDQVQMIEQIFNRDELVTFHGVDLGMHLGICPERFNTIGLPPDQDDWLDHFEQEEAFI